MNVVWSRHECKVCGLGAGKNYISVPIAWKPDQKSNCPNLPHANDLKNGKGKDVFGNEKRAETFIFAMLYMCVLIATHLILYLASHILVTVSEPAANNPFPMIISGDQFTGYFSKTETLGVRFLIICMICFNCTHETVLGC